MAQRDSPLYNFITKALMDNKYPSILYWIDTNEGIFCLKCLFRSNRQWTPLHSKIFDDYHNLKSRKSNDKRQRFLVAMKKCPFIESLNKRSTNQEKYYKFRACGTSSVDATDEIAVLSKSNEDAEMQTFSVASTAKVGAPSDDTSLDENIYNLHIEKDFENSLNPMMTDSESSLLQVLDGLEINKEFPTNIDLLHEKINSAVSDFAGNDLESPEIGASTSLYNDSIDLMKNSSCCSQMLDSSYPWNLQGEELSCHFQVKAENDYIPLDYDPAEHLIESMGTHKSRGTRAFDLSAIPKADPNLLRSAHAVSCTSEKSSKYQSVKIVRLHDNDEIVRSLHCDNPNKKLFLMVLNSESI